MFVGQARRKGDTMAQTFRGLGGATVAVVGILLLLSLSGCERASGKHQSAEAEFKQAREGLARAADRLSNEGRPVTDRAALAARLKLDPKRFAVINTGGRISRPTAAAFDFGSNCKFGHCECFGDRECNEMFSGICASPSTDGSCESVGDETICTCKYVDR